MVQVSAANDEAMRAWNGPLFDRFLQFRPVIVDSLAKHGDAALAAYPPPPGARVLDVGCGFGDASLQIADIVGSSGSVFGVDVAERFIEAAQEESAGVDNVSFAAVDVEAGLPEDGFDYAFSRFGTMFFANPVAALRNIRKALVPGGRLCMTVWRQKPDNPWTFRAEEVVKGLMDRPDDSDEPTCGPGPFSMANADTVSGQLLAAGFVDIELRRFDMDQLMGRDMDEALALVMAIGPAGEVLRLAGDRADHLRPQIEDMLRDGFADLVADDGRVYGGASSWIVSARA